MELKYDAENEYLPLRDVVFQALRQAIRMLAKLADGKRLIGVISHVADLKDAIPSQIRITKDACGSKIAVIR